MTGGINITDNQVPVALDPDLWSMTSKGTNRCQTELQISLTSAHHEEQTIRLHVRRHFELLPDDELLEFADCLAIEETATLEVLGGPLMAPAGQGDASQFFNDGGRFGNFGKLEHHPLAIVCAGRQGICTESTITHAEFLLPQNFHAWKHRFLNSSP